MDRNHELVRAATDRYVAQFGGDPTWCVAAPGRVNIIGEHTDYNGGFVLPMAIERWTVIVAGPKKTTPTSSCPAKKIAVISSREASATCEILIEEKILPTPIADWSSYVRGTVASMIDEGISVSPFCAAIVSDVPLGGGLSSSASLEVAVATLLETMASRTLDPVAKALACQKAEHLFAHMPCGIMDQFISVLGQKDHLMLLDCFDRTTRMIPLSEPDIEVLVTNSNVRHTLTGSEYPQRRADCEAAAKLLGVKLLRDTTPTQLVEARGRFTSVENGERIFRRAKHFLSEEVRTATLVAAMLERNWLQVGAMMYAGHESLKSDYEVSCPELDVLVEIAQQIGFEGGMIGSRMTGGGFGGCTVSLIRASRREDIIEQMAREYFARTGFSATLFTSRPAPGAMRIDGV